MRGQKPIPDAVGRQYGRLTVVSFSHKSVPYRRSIFLCRCQCGAMKTAEFAELNKGNIRSCGCLAQEMTATRSRRHGDAAEGKLTPEYMVWSSMRQRCLNPRAKPYPNYGGRGIRICKRWDKFANFLADMGRRPIGPRMTIERKNNNGNYTPSNCVWASYADQSRNRRSTRLTKGLVRTIKRRSNSGESVASIARSLSLHESTVRNVTSGIGWTDVT